MKQTLVFDESLIRRYDKTGPRYTSYPTAVQFNESFNVDTYMDCVNRSNDESSPKALSLYFHLPFCDTVCFYCGCSKIITKNRKHADPYLNLLHHEIELQGKVFDRNRMVEQLHWGGGTPTFINHQQMRDLMQHIRSNFSLYDDDTGEYSIELDPRETKSDTVKLLRELGFNRMSLGVQDFDPAVQKAVNRIQSLDETAAVINAARDEGFKSISVDLIYGLPLQSQASFATTLEKVVELNPDRVAIYNYAHLPQMFKTQRQIKEEELPSAQEKLAILHDAIDHMADAGYVYIGMDHFSKPEDELAIAQREGTLYRNFQGYSTHADCDIIGMGITSIGKVNNCYSQNVKSIAEYEQRISQDQLPVFRGYLLNDDDILRRDVITRLICNFSLDFASVARDYQIDFVDYFSAELLKLQNMQTDGLLTLNDAGIEVLPAGRLLIRNICMVFDAYLPPEQEQKRFSKLV